MDKRVKKEVNRLNKILTEAGLPESRIKLLNPIIENTAWMKVKLDDTRELVKDTSVVVPYDNGGGQKGLRESPIFKGYECLWKSYMSGMSIILTAVPLAIVERETDKIVESKTVLELVRDKHRKEA